jgi:hypothetical protein
MSYVNPSDTSPEAGKDRARDTVTGQSYDEVLKAYKEQVEFLRQELERKDTLLMFLTQRIPELEVHSESRGPSEKPLEGTVKGNVPPEQQEASQRPAWWRRFFGFV